MNIKKIPMNEQKMLELNKLREYNMFKFYNTSLKTPYSFICQNVKISLSKVLRVQMDLWEAESALCLEG